MRSESTAHESRGRGRRHRELLPAALAILLWLVGVADAQVRVALLRSSAPGPFTDAATALERALREGRRQPEILTFDLGGDPASVAAAMERVRQSAPAVVVTMGSLATSLALEASPPLDAPIVFSMVLYPAASGFLRRGRAVTGASLDVPLQLQFGMVRRLLPEARRVGVLHSEETASVVASAKEVAERVGLQLIGEPVDEPSRAPLVLDSLVHKIDVLWTVADGGVFTPQTTPALLLAALRSRKPMVGLSPGQVRSGALAAFVVDYEDVGRQTADLVTSILDGRRAAELPVTVPRQVKLALNLRTAELLHLSVPPDLLDEARVLVP